MRGKVDERERDLLALGDRELGDGAEILSPGLGTGEEREGVGTGGRGEQPVALHDPRETLPVAEADHQVHLHRHPARQTLDHADDLRVVLPDGHAIGDPDTSVLGLELGFQHERARAVPPPHRGHRSRRADRGDAPEPVLFVSEEARKAGLGVKAREAQPVDGPVPAH